MTPAAPITETLPEVEPLDPATLARVAELRAEGSSWTAAGRAVGLGADELKQHCKGAGRRYEKLYAAARREVMRGARQRFSRAVEAELTPEQGEKYRTLQEARRTRGQANAPGRASVTKYFTPLLPSFSTCSASVPTTNGCGGLVPTGS